MLYDSKESIPFKEYFTQKPVFIWLVIFCLFILGVGFGIFGIYELFSSNDQEIVSSSDVENQVCTQTTDFGQITVYISGAVAHPGVYVLNSGNRLADLVGAAGGISSVADKLYVNKQFNLAQRLSDGEQVYIPTNAETEAMLEVQQELILVNEAQQLSGIENPISINSSTKESLMELSGIGEVRATKIIENRPYNSIEELLTKEVISQSIFDEIKEKMVL